MRVVILNKGKRDLVITMRGREQTLEPKHSATIYQAILGIKEVDDDAGECVSPSKEQK